ncbi:MAG: phosphatase [Clostridiales bacterium]|nr:phosphatase [Clostridiales bacterium]
MNYSSDLHTHTIVSGHAYSTLMENINYCAENGIKILGTSEHGPSMPNAPHIWYFENFKVLPRTINNVLLLRGCEANILDINGNLDILPENTTYLDYLIASFHEPVFNPLSKEENTNAILNTIDKNNAVEILGHLGNPSYELDYEKILKKAKEKNIMIEINNSSVLGKSRKGSESNCKNIANLCMKYKVKIILTSDSHVCFTIGNFDKAINLLKSINFPEELIMNDPNKLINHFKSKGKLVDI